MGSIGTCFTVLIMAVAPAGLPLSDTGCKDVSQR
jgi:hypothetical protein